MSVSTNERLAWVMAQMQNLENGGNIRYEGNTTFQGAKGELADIIATYQDHSAAPAPVVLAAAPLDQVRALLAEVVAASADRVALAVAENTAHQVEQSDLAVLDAIAASQADMLAATEIIKDDLKAGTAALLAVLQPVEVPA